MAPPVPRLSPSDAPSSSPTPFGPVLPHPYPPQVLPMPLPQGMTGTGYATVQWEARGIVPIQTDLFSPLPNPLMCDSTKSGKQNRHHDQTPRTDAPRWPLSYATYCPPKPHPYVPHIHPCPPQAPLQHAPSKPALK